MTASMPVWYCDRLFQWPGRHGGASPRCLIAPTSRTRAAEPRALLRARIGVMVVDDAQISRLKEQYFGFAQATDVISFNLTDENSDSVQLDCDLVVNAAVAHRQGPARHGSALAELLLYITHGLLHQLGYDDSGPDDAAVMHAREDELLGQLGFGGVYHREPTGSIARPE